MTKGIVKLSYFVNKKLRCLYLPTFINIQSLSQYKKSKENVILKLTNAVEFINHKYYKVQVVRAAFDSLKGSSKNYGDSSKKINKI